LPSEQTYPVALAGQRQLEQEVVLPELQVVPWQEHWKLVGLVLHQILCINSMACIIIQITLFCHFIIRENCISNLKVLHHNSCIILYYITVVMKYCSD